MRFRSCTRSHQPPSEIFVRVRCHGHGHDVMTIARAADEKSPGCQVINGRPAWLLRLRTTEVLLWLGANDALLLPYWGPTGQSGQATDYLLHPQGNRPSQRQFLDGQPLAFPVYGDPLFKEVCLLVARPDGF